MKIDTVNTLLGVPGGTARALPAGWGTTREWPKGFKINKRSDLPWLVTDSGEVIEGDRAGEGYLVGVRGRKLRAYADMRVIIGDDNLTGDILEFQPDGGVKDRWEWMWVMEEETRRIRLLRRESVLGFYVDKPDGRDVYTTEPIRNINKEDWVDERERLTTIEQRATAMVRANDSAGIADLLKSNALDVSANNYALIKTAVSVPIKEVILFNLLDFAGSDVSSVSAELFTLAFGSNQLFNINILLLHQYIDPADRDNELIFLIGKMIGTDDRMNTDIEEELPKTTREQRQFIVQYGLHLLDVALESSAVRETLAPSGIAKRLEDAGYNIVLNTVKVYLPPDPTSVESMQEYLDRGSNVQMGALIKSLTYPGVRVHTRTIKDRDNARRVFDAILDALRNKYPDALVALTAFLNNPGVKKSDNVWADAVADMIVKRRVDDEIGAELIEAYWQAGEFTSNSAPMKRIRSRLHRDKTGFMKSLIEAGESPTTLFIHVMDNDVELRHIAVFPVLMAYLIELPSTDVTVQGHRAYWMYRDIAKIKDYLAERREIQEYEALIAKPVDEISPEGRGAAVLAVLDESVDLSSMHADIVPSYVATRLQYGYVPRNWRQKRQKRQATDVYDGAVAHMIGGHVRRAEYVRFIYPDIVGEVPSKTLNALVRSLNWSESWETHFARYFAASLQKIKALVN